MKIPNINGLVNSTATYFFQSSWKGKTVQILCAVSLLSLIYYVAFRLKKTDKPEPSSLNGRVNDVLTQVQMSQDFESFLSDKMNDCDGWIANAKEGTVTYLACLSSLEANFSVLKEQTKKMISVFQTYPEVKTDDWDNFLRECDTPVDTKTDFYQFSGKIKTWLTKLQSWNLHLKNVIKKSPAFLKAQLMQVSQTLPQKIKECDQWITLANGNLAQQATCSRFLKKAVDDLKEQVKDTVPDQFLNDYNTILGPKASLQESCNRLKACLIKLQSHIVDVLNGEAK